MGFRQLVDDGADRTAIQAYLAKGDMLTTTIRIPANLKETLAEEAALSGMSVSAYIRQCVINHLVAEAGGMR